MTESMNQLNLARKAGKGGGGSVTVIDNLNSTSTTAALSANQGRILGLSTTSLDMQLQDEEGIPFYFDKKEGKYGFNTDEARGSETFHAFGEGGGGSVTVIDNLDSTSSTDALSANMGHTLNTSLTTVSNNLSAYDTSSSAYTNTKFRFATDGEGNFGYLKADDSFAPFKSKNTIVKTVSGTKSGKSSWTTFESVDVSKIKNAYVAVGRYGGQNIPCLRLLADNGSVLVTTNTSNNSVAGFGQAYKDLTNVNTINVQAYSNNNYANPYFEQASYIIIPTDTIVE